MKFFEQNIPKLKRYSSEYSTEEQERRKIQQETNERYNQPPIEVLRADIEAIKRRMGRSDQWGEM
jgi:ubiquinone biosynthesis protein UbiJ